MSTAQMSRPAAAPRKFSPPSNRSDRQPSPAPSARPQPQPQAARPPSDRPEPEILFQTFFKSPGTRTYAAQLKKTAGGDHFLVLTEGKRDPKTEEVRKSRVFVFSEDFVSFFKLLHETAQFIKANPVPEDVKRRQQKFWAKKRSERDDGPSAPAADDARDRGAPRR